MTTIEINFLKRDRLVKVIGIRGFNNSIKVERMFSSYNEAKNYAKYLELNDYITVFEITPFYSYEDVVSEIVSKLEKQDVELVLKENRLYV